VKSILLGFILTISFSNAFADNAVDAFKSILPPGEYKGNAFTGECTVLVEEVNYPEFAFNVTVKAAGDEMFKVFNDKAIYAVNVGKKFFLQTDRTLFGTSHQHYIEKVVRTMQNNDDTLNVKVAEIIVIANSYDENMLECNIPLTK
jgi:hypothetical protein